MGFLNFATNPCIDERFCTLVTETDGIVKHGVMCKSCNGEVLPRMEFVLCFQSLSGVVALHVFLGNSNEGCEYQCSMKVTKGNILSSVKVQMAKVACTLLAYAFELSRYPVIAFTPQDVFSWSFTIAGLRWGKA